MKSSREQFEERFPAPAGVRWDESNQCYVCKFVSPYLALWMGWQASREVIDAPGKMSEWPDDNHGEYGRGYNDCHAEWEQALGISDGN